MKEEKILIELIERYPKLESCRETIKSAYEILSVTFGNKKKLLVAGNGGSAADSEHIVGELMKGFIKRRELEEREQQKILEVDKEFGESLCKNLQQALPAIALTGHIALTTAYLNDVEGKIGFAQQLYAYGEEGDTFLGITTSGNSDNILYTMVAAKSKGLATIALTGKDGGRIKEIADVSIIVPEIETFKIQELHLPIYHTLCLML